MKGKELLEDRYGDIFKDQHLTDITSVILQRNQEKIAHSVVTTDKKRFQDNLDKIRPTTSREKKLKLPDVGNVVRRSSSLVKVAEKGQMINETLRNKLRIKLKNVLLEEGITTTRGTVRMNLAKKLEAGFAETFKGYTDTGGGVPANIKTIARTETMFMVSAIRREYAQKVAEDSPDVRMRKVWLHRGSLSKKHRTNHRKMHKRAILITGKFTLVGKDGNKYSVDGPHDPRLPAAEFINCNCQEEYRMSKKKV